MNSQLLFRKKIIVFVVLVCIILAFGTETTYAQEKYPSKYIEIIITFAPGGTNDLTTRIFAEPLSKVLNVSVVCSNKPGATGTIGSAFVLKSKKDGYTILTNSGSGMVIAPHILRGVPYDTLKDFIPISLIAATPVIMLVKNDSPFKSFEDLMDFAKKNPGKLTYGSAGTGSDTHLAMEQLQYYSKVKFSHIPYKGGGETLPAVLGGHVDFSSTLLATASSNLRAGTVRGLVIFDTKRSSFFPNIPIAREKGYPQHFIKYWNGLFVPTGTPKEVVDVLTNSSERVVKMKEYISKIEDLGASIDYMSPAEYKKFIEEDIKVVREIIEKIELKPAK